MARKSGEGVKFFERAEPPTPALSPPKSDISDFGHLTVPHSGKPEFGSGEGADQVRCTACIQREKAMIVFWNRSCHFSDWSSMVAASMISSGPLVKGESIFRLGETKLRLARIGCASPIRKS